jgi:hypothetical protein
MTKKNKIWTYAAVLGGAFVVYYLYKSNASSTTAAANSSVVSAILAQISPARTQQQMAAWVTALPLMSAQEIAALKDLLASSSMTPDQTNNWVYLTSKYHLA